jgi:hypothetical protein
MRVRRTFKLVRSPISGNIDKSPLRTRSAIRRHFFLPILEQRPAVPKPIASLAATEEGVDVTQKDQYARSNEYATRGDFCHIYVEQLNSLYLLSRLLTADPPKAEQCFLSGFEDSVSNHSVFKERAHLWARRGIILHAIRLLCPRPNDENELHEARPSPLNGEVPAEVRAYPNFARVVGLNSFERFVFIMSILEKYSQHECSLLLGCLRRDVNNARTAAMRHLASVAIATETQPERDAIVFAGVSANR